MIFGFSKVASSREVVATTAVGESQGTPQVFPGLKRRSMRLFILVDLGMLKGEMNRGFSQFTPVQGKNDPKTYVLEACNVFKIQDVLCSYSTVLSF